MVEIIDKIKGKVKRVNKEFEIVYDGQMVKLKDLEKDDFEIYGLIFHLDGEIELFLREKRD